MFTIIDSVTKKNTKINIYLAYKSPQNDFIDRQASNRYHGYIQESSGVIPLTNLQGLKPNKMNY